jgi:hypothetical protein
MPATYEPIATTTLTSANNTVTFNSISGTYTDLRLVIQAKYSDSQSQFTTMTFNNDTASNYSNTLLIGNGSTATSERESNKNGFNIMYTGGASQWFMTTIDVFNYANTTTFKTTLFRDNVIDTRVEARVGLWRKTPEAITSIKFYDQFANFITGSTFTLYGIKAA